MPLFAYNRNIPDGPNNPSADQPLMQINTNSTDDLIDVDHYSFDEANGGLHRQVQMPVLGSIPVGLIPSSGTIYTKTSTGSQLFYSPDNTGNEYQLTRANTTNFTSFSTNNAYGTPPATFTQQGGWTFLPGGMLLQYGFYGKTGALGTSGQVQFPIAFTNAPYSLTLVLIRSGAGSSPVVVLDNGTIPTTTTFNFVSSSGGSDGIYWTAIGV